MTSPISYRGIARVLTRIAGPVAAAIALAGPAQAATIYSQNFTTGTAGFTGGTYATTVSGEKYLQLANSSEATLATNQTGFTGRTLTFNLYGIESVDGNGPDGGGPDNFLIYFNGSATAAYNINIANYNSGSNTQSYNGNLATSGPTYTYAPFTGAVARGTLGYGTGPFGDSTYLVSFAIADSVTSIRFVGATNESVVDPTGASAGGNEAYGIDNVVLTGTAVTTPPVAAVPEPATWAMMLVGFAAAGTALRRRHVARPALA